jgi:hypothetical protein
VQLSVLKSRGFTSRMHLHDSTNQSKCMNELRAVC